MKLFLRTWLVIGFAYLPSLSYAESVAPVTKMSPANGQLNVLSQSRYFIDNENFAALKDLKTSRPDGIDWQPLPAGRLLLPRTEAAVWIQFRLQNSGTSEELFYLQSDDSLTSYLDIYITGQTGSQTVNTGTLRPFSARPFPHHTFITPLQLQPGEVITVTSRFSSKRPMSIGLEVFSPAGLWTKLTADAALLWAFFGLMVAIFIYNLFMFVSVKERAYAFYLLYLLAFFWFSLVYTGLGSQLIWPNSTFFADYSIPLSVIAITFSLYFFSFELAAAEKNELRFLPLLYTTVAVFLVITVMHMFALEVAWLTRAFVISLAPMALTGFGIFAHSAFVSNNGPAKRFVYSFSFFCLGLVILVLRNVGLLPDNLFTRYAYLYGAAIQISLTSLILADRMNSMKRLVELSSKRYRRIIENSDELIFTLDAKGRFTSMNSQALHMLRFPPEDMLGKPLSFFIQDDGGDQNKINKQLLTDALNGGGGGPIILPFRQRNGIEPAILSLRFFHSEFEGEKETIGIGVIHEKDMFAAFLQNEKQTYFLNNYLSNAQLLSFRLTHNLYKFLESNVIHQIQAGLREVLINAIEHGNLGISFTEKSNSLNDDSYFKLLKERRGQLPYKNRNVKVEYNLNHRRIIFRITDDGQGFDHKSVFNNSLQNANDNLLEHGRGIWMTRQVFDKVEYNDRGNQVTLVKNFTFEDAP